MRSIVAMQIEPLLKSDVQPTRLVLVEDNVLLRRMLREIAVMIPGLKWGMGCGSLAEARRQLEADSNPPYGLIVDVALPDGKGWELLESPMVQSEGSRVFLATGRVDEYTLSLLSGRRVSGFIDKCSADLQDWKDAFECLSEGRRYISSSISSAVVKMLSKPDHWSKLFTLRESSLIRMLCEGGTNSRIAEKTGNSPSTIQVHRRNIMRKLKLNTAPELMRWGTVAGFTG